MPTASSTGRPISRSSSPCARPKGKTTRSTWSSRRRAARSSRRLHTLTYMKPGDKLPIAKPHLFEVGSRKEIPISDELFPNPWSLDQVRWEADGKRVHVPLQPARPPGAALHRPWTPRPARRARSSTTRARRSSTTPASSLCTSCRRPVKSSGCPSAMAGITCICTTAQDRQGEEPDHQGEVGRPRRGARGRRTSARSGSAPAASIPSRTRITSTIAASISTAPA